MANKPLTEVINEMVEADRVYLPVHPDISLHVSKLLGPEEFDLKELRWLIGRDPGLLCNLFRAANSSFPGSGDWGINRRFDSGIGGRSTPSGPFSSK